MLYQLNTVFTLMNVEMIDCGKSYSLIDMRLYIYTQETFRLK